MPSKTRAQERFFAMCANNAEKARGKCPPAKVSREWHAADKRLARKGRGRLHKRGKSRKRR